MDFMEFIQAVAFEFLWKNSVPINGWSIMKNPLPPSESR